MRKDLILLSLLLAGLAGLSASTVSAQAAPVSRVIKLATLDEENGVFDPDAIVLTDGRFAVGMGSWSPAVSDYPWNDFWVTDIIILNRNGKKRNEIVVDSGSDLGDWQASSPVLAPAPDGGFVSVWDVGGYGARPLFLQRFTAQGEPWSFNNMSLVPEIEGLCTDDSDIAANEEGRHAVVWTTDRCGRDTPVTLGFRTFDAAGQPGPEVQLVLGSAYPDLGRLNVGLDRNHRAITTWVQGTVLRGQFFDQTGYARGPSVTLIQDVAEKDAFLGMTPAGSFLLAWTTFDELAGWQVQLQWHTAEGQPAGPGLAYPGRSLTALAADSRGNFALLRRGTSDLLLMDLFNRDLVRQGEPIPVGTSPADWWYRDNSLALSDTGRLLTVWSLGSLARMWQARHEADACVRRGKLFLCDTANNGADAEVRLLLGEGHPEEIPFLADWDGDGRADPCLYRSGKFFCDTGHEGGTDVRSPAVGMTGDKPLLGDLNGDGKADPCVRRGAAILCDLARDGGSKDLRIVFGTAGDKVLLGDPNGDGKDDPCLLRAGHLLCDTAHNGGLGELRLDLRPLAVQGPTLFGDVNGDGRDEACRFTGDRFVCGVYPINGGVPTERIEIVFGQPGDIPLLGDLDAF